MAGKSADFWRFVRATDRARGTLPARPTARRRGASRKARGRWRPSRNQLFLALGLGALLWATHWLGVFPRTVDGLAGAPSRYDVTGIAKVVDGDTLRIGSVRIRLTGIDAPEKDAVCTNTASGAHIACGAEAGRRLAALVEGRTVRCVGEGIDRYKRTLANCWIRDRSQDVDIGRRLVRTGWALAYRRFSHRYAYDETRARLEGLGLWAMDFQNPEEDRHDGKQLSMR